MSGPAIVTRGDAGNLHLPDETVDLIVTSPPYFGLRSYQDACPDCAEQARAANRGYMERYCPKCSRVFASGRNKCHTCDVTTLRTAATKAANAKTDCATCGGTGTGHYAGQVGDEATPAEYLDALMACTAEWMRVLKPGGSIFVNLGDKYSGAAGPKVGGRPVGLVDGHNADRWVDVPRGRAVAGAPAKSLFGLPWRYAIRCIDELGLILRAEIVWAKPNGLPESVTDRVRRSHEQVFHFVKQPRYYSAVDEVREQHSPATLERNSYARPTRAPSTYTDTTRGVLRDGIEAGHQPNPLGKLPGSVWTIPTAPLKVPESLGIDHFAAYPPELVRRIVLGWSPREVCTACGEGRRPTTEGTPMVWRESPTAAGRNAPGTSRKSASGTMLAAATRTITGYACACPDTDAPAAPGVVLDPFGGTGTTALVASAFGRVGISVDLSADYCRLAQWRTTDPGERARVLGVAKPPAQVDGQLGMFEGVA